MKIPPPNVVFNTLTVVLIIGMVVAVVLVICTGQGATTLGHCL